MKSVSQIVVFVAFVALSWWAYVKLLNRSN
jgi:hypothetical protein